MRKLDGCVNVLLMEKGKNLLQGQIMSDLLLKFWILERPGDDFCDGLCSASHAIFCTYTLHLFNDTHVPPYGALAYASMNLRSSFG